MTFIIYRCESITEILQQQQEANYKVDIYVDEINEKDGEAYDYYTAHEGALNYEYPSWHKEREELKAHIREWAEKERWPIKFIVK